jgi:hypothetical protein
MARKKGGYVPEAQADAANLARMTLSYNIQGLSEATGASDSAIYKDIQLGLLESFLVGKRHLVEVDAAKKWLARKAAGKRHQKNKGRPATPPAP